MTRQIVIRFNPLTMRVDKNDPTVIYDSGRKLSDSAATISGNIYIGVKDRPSALAIRDTIRHEKSHTGHKVAKNYFEAARQELQAYEREKKHSSAQRWNRILPIRVNDFLPSVTYLTKPQQIKIAPEVARILIAKPLPRSGYSDRKSQRLSRQKRRGFRRVKFS